MRWGPSDGEWQIEIASRGADIIEDARADQASHASAQCIPIDERRHVQLPRNALGIKVPINPTVATETVSAALAFAKCGITIRHSELSVVVPFARLMTA